MFCIRLRMKRATGKQFIKTLNIVPSLYNYRARCGFTITVSRQRGPPPNINLAQNSTFGTQSVLQLPPQHQQQQPTSPYPHCNKTPSVPNGDMICVLQQTRLKCTPVCKRNHVFYQKFTSRPPTYICDKHRL